MSAHLRQQRIQIAVYIRIGLDPINRSRPNHRLSSPAPEKQIGRTRAQFDKVIPEQNKALPIPKLTRALKAQCLLISPYLILKHFKKTRPCAVQWP